MKSATLLPSKPKGNAEAWCYSSRAPPNLENRVLAQASSLLSQPLSSPPSWATLASSTFPCPALQPSILSSTTTSSPLFSTSSLLSSSLLSTENTQLKQDLLLFSSSSSLCSPFSPLLQSTAPPGGGLTPSLNYADSVEKQLNKKLRKRKKEQTEPLATDHHQSHSEDVNEYEECKDVVVPDHVPPVKMPLLDLRLTSEEEKQTVDLFEEFGELESQSDEQVELLKDMKYMLLNVVCCSLVNKACAPGQEKWDDKMSVWSQIKKLATDITHRDPEFLLKVAIYARQELNIRITSNFLLALAAHLPASKPHLRRYFCAAVQLPSDWLEVTRIYSMCFSRSLPTCLKKALVDKFKQFNEYQLAKYNTRKHRCKHSSKKRKAPAVSEEQWEKWARMVRADADVLKRIVQADERPVVDKKQSEFNMKKMIQRLHIKEPAEFVMSILGKRYPSDLRAFVQSGLSGVWQSERAGQRMKLKQPETWETRLSLEGNKAATWEKLIDSNSLPFMAMLRNLRNMIRQGISAKHHDKILKKLTSKSAVIHSRQFPFRFLSAYKVIMELSTFSGATTKPKPNSKEILLKILKGIPRCRLYSRRDWAGVTRRRLRATLSVPYIYRHFSSKHKLIQKASSQKKYSQELLDQYRQALEKAVQISCRYNIPPLSGHTLILFGNYWREMPDWRGGDGFCLPPEVSDKAENTTSVQELAMLLAMMVIYCCERSQLLFTCDGGVKAVQLESDNLLDNVRRGLKLLVEFSEDSRSQVIPHSDFFSRLIEEKTKVDNIILVNDDDFSSWMLDKEVAKYQKNCINDPLVVKIIMRPRKNHNTEIVDPKTVELCGFSEQMLRFISERGSSRLLDHVEHIDKLHGVPPPAGGAAEQDVNLVLLPPTPKLRWRGVRVFISSTFRDMHAERDVLVRGVFPELRRRAAPHCLYLQEVELRWGVTEEEVERAVPLCLSEVCRSQLLLGILGERYGQVPPRPSLPDLPQYHWLNSAPTGLSITEMEIRQFEALYPDSAQKRMFFYFRSPQLVSSVPEDWRGDFEAESKEAAAKMENLKSRIRNSGYKITENYPCEWGGIVDKRPYVKGLEDFAKAALDDLWAGIQQHFVEEVDETDVRSEIAEQDLYHDIQQRHFHGRGKLVSNAVKKVQECQQKGGIVLVQGAHGEGKTAFMAALALALRTPDQHSKVPVCDVISYSTAASQSAARVEKLLLCLVQWLRKRRDQKVEMPSSTPYRELLSELHTHLKELRKGQSLVMLVDGADLMHDARGQIVSEWIPEHIPKGVCLVLSVTTHSSLHNTISKKKVCVLFPLGHLSLPDRKLIVQKSLSVYGKKLSDSAFNNQLQTLLMKKGAASPLYLHIACEELRNYASFETMKNSLQVLPQSLCELVQHGLLRLQSQCGGAGVDWMLAALTVSSTGLKERDLYSLLNLCTDLKSMEGTLTWSKVLHLTRNPNSRVPMAVFSQLSHALQSLIQPSLSHEPDQPLTLTHPEVRTAFERLYISTEEDQVRAHLVLAAYLYVQSDPHGNDTFLHCDADSLLHLHSHLMKSGQWEVTRFLLTSYYFLYANVRHGLLHPLLETYIQFGINKPVKHDITEPSCRHASGDLREIADCQSFLKRHAALLSHWPALFVQQALNEADECSARAWAEKTVAEGGVHAVKWLNNTELHQQGAGELVSTFKGEPSCVALSPAGGLMVVGTEQATLHLIHTDTRQEVKSLVSNCDGISGCVFLDEGVLGVSSYNGQVEVWDINNGCRIAHMNAHSNRITGCDVSPDRKHFATVSLDFSLRVWSSQKSKEVVCLENPSPLNCVTFHPEGVLLAVGCWDGAVRVWDWITQKNCTTLSGHRCSVRSVSFSPFTSLLCSGCLSGEVRLWSVAGAACVGRYHAHHGSTEALSFLPTKDTLVSAGQDGMVQVWSGGLGRSAHVFGKKKSRYRTAGVSEDAALSVAVSNGYAAVGYHGDGVKVYSVESSEVVWSSEGLRVSVSCLLWLDGDRGELLLSGASDQRLRLWRRRRSDAETLSQRGAFGVQKGPILALAHNSTHLASASDDFTIALWLKSDLTSDPWVEPRPVGVLRSHKGGVTCLAFSPDGNELLSGGKDQALMVWKLDGSSPVLSHALRHCHGDWITACAWTASAVLSCSSDCRLRLWDLQRETCIREVATTSPLSTLCCWEDYVMVGSAHGLLTVWKSDLGVIAEIQAHQSRIHYSTVISTAAAGDQRSEELLIATASEDGTVKLWHPLQVEHRGTLLGHSGAIQALASGRGPRFLTVSEDRSLIAWSTHTESRPIKLEPVTALCFLETEALLVCGYGSGRLELWSSNSLVYSTKVNDSCVRAVACIPDEQLAVGCSDCTVSIWKLESHKHQNTTVLSRVMLFTLESSVLFMHYCNVLLGVCVNGTVVDIFSTVKENPLEVTSWKNTTRVLGLDRGGENTLWLLGEEDNVPSIALLVSAGRDIQLSSCHGSLRHDEEEDDHSSEHEEEERRKSAEHSVGKITAAAMRNEFVVCGDSKGNMWFNQTANMCVWTARRPVHSDRISVLRLTDRTIISASYDKSIKLWDRETKKQMGMFVCAAAVEVLEVNPSDPTQIVCADALGQLYFLCWTG